MLIVIPGYVRCEIYQRVLQNPNITSLGKYFKTLQAGCSNSHSLEVKTQCEESGQKSWTNKQCRQSLQYEIFCGKLDVCDLVSLSSYQLKKKI